MRKGYVEWDGAKKEIILRKLVYSCEGCRGRWFVKDFNDEHTHPLAPRDLACLLHSHRRVSDEQKADIIEMEISGIRKHKIMDVLCMQSGGYNDVGCTIRDIYNFCHLYKQEIISAGDAHTLNIGA